MKKIFITGALGISSIFFAQVGVNTPEPKATFDINAKEKTGTARGVDGLLIPRVDRQRAQSMTGVETSTLIYVNDAATGTQTGTAINVDAIGYYYFDGKEWVKLNSGASGNGVNIYNTDGTLTGDRVVTQGTNKLAFNGTGVNSFSIDGNTFSVDATNNRIGVGTITPAGIVDITADNKGGGAANNFYFKGYGNSKEPAIIFGSSNGTEAAPANLNNGEDIASIYFAPRANNTLNIVNATSILTKYRGDGTTVLTDLLFRTSGQDRLRIDENGNTGIGTSTPTNLLHLNSATAGALKIVDGTQGVNKVLTSDADGVATWKDATGGSDTNIYNADGTLTGDRIVTQGANKLAFQGSAVNAFSLANTLSVDTKNNRLGLGTTAPTGVVDIVADNKGGGAANNFNFRGYGTSKEPAIIFSSSNGTETAPTNLNNGDDIASIYFAPRANGTVNTVSGTSILTKYRGDGTTILTDLLLKTSGQDRLKIDENGNVGIGTSTPTEKISIVDATTANQYNGIASFLPSNLTQGVGIGWGGIQSVGTMANINFNLSGKGTGNILMGTNGNTGNVAIGNTDPTSKLDVAGDVRVRTIPLATGTAIITPVYSDANGVLTKTSATVGSILSGSSPSVAAGATAQLIASLPTNAIYKASISTSDACLDSAVAEFYISTAPGNNFYSITGTTGFVISGATLPTFNKISRASTGISWTGKTVCSGDGATNAFNYTLAMPNASTINITNNGGATRVYRIILTRVS